ncbi:GNAT family N-acetyltransferase [Parasphingopyxis marina]|uniref:N-acetyltransferase n=1 Tax=Parasphingopyxis marina TaxID=2761622 RepID=A0A842I312_9SPHN|nr:N-acetyltransferase [Parasphingopyxis marina]MBC2778710.1 N-acetyltransferase [Parasphingopyxis marina]
MIEIREAAGDGAAIRAVHEAAFDTDMEAWLVEKLAADGDLRLSLVALREDHCIGNLILSAMKAQADGKPFNAIALGPIGVLPECQKSGVGSALMEAAIAWARDEGYAAIFLLGDPNYYGRFGFSVEKAQPFASPYMSEYWQLLPLSGDFVLPKSASAAYADAFAMYEDE